MARHGIGLARILDAAVVAALPPGAEAVGWLNPAPGGLVDPARGLVFHAAHPVDRAAVLLALRCFRPRLPPEVRLVLAADAEGACPTR